MDHVLMFTIFMIDRQVTAKKLKNRFFLCIVATKKRLKHIAQHLKMDIDIATRMENFDNYFHWSKNEKENAFELKMLASMVQLNQKFIII